MLQSRVQSQWVGKGESPPGPGAQVTLAEPLPRGGQQEALDGLSLALWVVVLPIPPQEPDSRSPGRARRSPWPSVGFGDCGGPLTFSFC